MKLLTYATKAKTKQKGLALLMVVFVIALASVIVINLSYQSRFDARASRSFGESIQADYVLKSGINVAQVLLNLPKGIDSDKRTITEDYLGDWWSRIDQMQDLSNILSGVVGEVRMQIVDEDGKINLNSILYSPNSKKEASFWLNHLSQLFDILGFTFESYDDNSFRTRGNQAFDSATQVATIEDWIDDNTSSFNESDAGFTGIGVESSLSKSFFYNRPLRTLSETLLIPGITLERLSRMAPFVSVESRKSGNKININTAPKEVLLALDMQEDVVDTVVEMRTTQPWTAQTLNDILKLSRDPEIKNYLKVKSDWFSVVVRVKTSNATRWARAIINAPESPAPPSRKTTVKFVEFY